MCISSSRPIRHGRQARFYGLGSLTFEAADPFSPRVLACLPQSAFRASDFRVVPSSEFRSLSARREPRTIGSCVSRSLSLFSLVVRPLRDGVGRRRSSRIPSSKSHSVVHVIESSRAIRFFRSNIDADVPFLQGDNGVIFTASTGTLRSPYLAIMTQTDGINSDMAFETVSNLAA
jgi:hypothetical protein